MSSTTFFELGMYLYPYILFMSTRL